MINMNNENEIKRSKYFKNKNIKIHICKNTGEFLNGLIVDIQDDFFIINDKIKGDQFVYFSELKKPIEPYYERRNL